MRQSGLFRHAVRCKRGEPCGDRGSDIGSDQERHRRIEIDQSSGGKRENDADRRRAGLNQERGEDADPDCPHDRPDRHEAAVTVRGAVEEFEKVHEGGKRSEGPQFIAHHRHAEENQPEAENRRSPAFHDAVFGDHDEETNGNSRKRQPGKIERNDLRSHRGSDIRTENDSDRLPQSQKPRVDEADHHDSRCTRRLDHRSDNGSGENGNQTVARKILKELLHVLARDLLKPVRHQLHSEYEESQSSDHPDDHGDKVDAEDAHLRQTHEIAAFRVRHLDRDLIFAGLSAELNMRLRHTVVIRNAERVRTFAVFLFSGLEITLK